MTLISIHSAVFFCRLSFSSDSSHISLFNGHFPLWQGSLPFWSAAQRGSFQICCCSQLPAGSEGHNWNRLWIRWNFGILVSCSKRKTVRVRFIETMSLILLFSIQKVFHPPLLFLLLLHLSPSFPLPLFPPSSPESFEKEEEPSNFHR